MVHFVKRELETLLYVSPVLHSRHWVLYVIEILFLIYIDQCSPILPRDHAGSQYL
jgi:hypothetical protein